MTAAFIMFCLVLLAVIVCNVWFAVTERRIVIWYLFYSLFFLSVAVCMYRPWLFFG